VNEIRRGSEPVEAEVDITQWFGPEAISEYWDNVKSMAELCIQEKYGDRCPDFDENCVLCKKWKAFDELFNQ